MIESSSTFQARLERSEETLNEFIVRMNKFYPDSKKDLGAYILMRL
jgi:hypothetical protein